MPVDLRTEQEYLNAKAGTVGLTKQQALQYLAGASAIGMTAQDAAAIYAGLTPNNRPSVQDSLQRKVGVPTASVIGPANSGSTGGTQFGAAGTLQKAAQSFIPIHEYISTIIVRKRAGGGTYIGDVTISLQGDNNGSPNGDIIASSVIPNATWEALASQAPTTLTVNKYVSVGATYWIVFDSSTQDAVNFPRFDASGGDLYTPGLLKFYNGSTWPTILPITDAWFQVTSIITDSFTEQEAARRL